MDVHLKTPLPVPVNITNAEIDIVVNVEDHVAVEPGNDPLNVVGPLTDAQLRADSVGIVLSDGPQLDAFGRLRTSDPESVFDSKHIRGIMEELFWDQSTASGGTVAVNAANSEVNLTLPTTSGASAIYQTKEYFTYQSGKSQQILMTGTVGTAQANVRQRMGYFDVNDGIFLEQTSTDKRLVVRTSASGSPIDANFAAQSDWNMDKLDGTGSSGITLDLSKAQILFIDFQWLGVGRVRIGFVINGTLIIAHEFRSHANFLTAVYMKNPNLPVRYEIVNTGTSAGATMSAICSEVASEGGRQFRGLSFSADMGSAVKTLVNGTATPSVFTPLIAIRLKSAFNRIPVRPVHFSFLTQSANPVLLRIYIIRAGGTGSLTGASFASAGTQSSVEFDVASTAFTIGDSICIHSEYVSNQLRSILTDLASYSSLKVCSNIAGVSDIMLICGQAIGGTAVNSQAELSWLEEI